MRQEDENPWSARLETRIRRSEDAVSPARTSTACGERCRNRFRLKWRNLSRTCAQAAASSLPADQSGSAGAIASTANCRGSPSVAACSKRLRIPRHPLLERLTISFDLRIEPRRILHGARGWPEGHGHGGHRVTHCPTMDSSPAQQLARVDAMAGEFDCRPAEDLGRGCAPLLPMQVSR